MRQPWAPLFLWFKALHLWIFRATIQTVNFKHSHPVRENRYTGARKSVYCADKVRAWGYLCGHAVTSLFERGLKSRNNFRLYDVSMREVSISNSFINVTIIYSMADGFLRGKKQKKNFFVRKFLWKDREVEQHSYWIFENSLSEDWRIPWWKDAERCYGGLLLPRLVGSVGHNIYSFVPSVGLTAEGDCIDKFPPKWAWSYTRISDLLSNMLCGLLKLIW